VGSVLQRALPVDTLVVAIDPGKVQHRVWLSTDAAGLLVEPLTLPVLRAGLDALDRLIDRHVGARATVIAVEATGARCTGRGSGSWSGGGRAVFGCSRRRRRRLRGRSWAVAGSRPTTGTALR
jgi:hypothetical protein